MQAGKDRGESGEERKTVSVYFLHFLCVFPQPSYKTIAMTMQDIQTREMFVLDSLTVYNINANYQSVTLAVF